MTNNKVLGYIAAFISALLLGAMGIFVRNIDANPYVITFARLGFGLLFLFVYIVLKSQVRELKLSHWNWRLVVTGVLLATTSLCYINAINSTTLANAVFLLYLGPLMAVGLAALFLKERLSLISGGLLLLAFSGFLFLIEFNFDFRTEAAEGFMWGIVSALCYAIYIILNRQMPVSISAPIRSFYQLLFGALVVVPFLDKSVLHIASTDWVWLVSIGFFHGFLAFTLIIFSLKYLRAVQYGTISYIEPLVAAFIGIVLYGESLSILQGVGFALIMAGGLTQVLTTKS